MSRGSPIELEFGGSTVLAVIGRRWRLGKVAPRPLPPGAVGFDRPALVGVITDEVGA